MRDSIEHSTQLNPMELQNAGKNLGNPTVIFEISSDCLVCNIVSNSTQILCNIFRQILALGVGELVSHKARLKSIKSHGLGTILNQIAVDIVYCSGLN